MILTHFSHFFQLILKPRKMSNYLDLFPTICNYFRPSRQLFLNLSKINAIYAKLLKIYFMSCTLDVIFLIDDSSILRSRLAYTCFCLWGWGVCVCFSACAVFQFFQVFRDFKWKSFLSEENFFEWKDFFEWMIFKETDFKRLPVASNLSPCNLFSHIKYTLPAAGNLIFDQKKVTCIQITCHSKSFKIFFVSVY